MYVRVRTRTLAVRTVVRKNIWEFWTQTKTNKNEVWLKRRRMSVRPFLVLFIKIEAILGYIGSLQSFGLFTHSG